MRYIEDMISFKEIAIYYLENNRDQLTLAIDIIYTDAIGCIIVGREDDKITVPLDYGARHQIKAQRAMIDALEMLGVARLYDNLTDDLIDRALRLGYTTHFSEDGEQIVFTRKASLGEQRE